MTSTSALSAVATVTFRYLFIAAALVGAYYSALSARASFLFQQNTATSEITPYPADPVFAQMWLMNPHPDQIARHVPDRPGILLQYSSFLANAHQYAAIPPIVRRLVIAAGEQSPADYGRDDQIGPTV